MSVNRMRGEVGVTLAGESFRLCLTLGALAEIQSGFGVMSIGAIASRIARAYRKDLELVFNALRRGGEGAAPCEWPALAGIASETLGRFILETLEAAIDAP